MSSKQTLFLSLLITFYLAILLIPQSSGSKPSSRQSALGGNAEFHLTCTVLVNGAPTGDASEAGGGAEAGDDGGGDYESGDDDVAGRKNKNKGGKRSKKKSKKNQGEERRRKRSLRVKRQTNLNKVQLLCDIDNPKGREIAMRSVEKKKAAKKV